MRPEPYSNRITEWRRLRNLTGAELARRCAPATSPSTITQLETGRRALTQAWLYRLAAVLDCLPVELLPEGDGMPLKAEERELLEVWRTLTTEERERLKIRLKAPSGARPAPAIELGGSEGDPRFVEVEVEHDGSYRVRVYYQPSVKRPD